VSEVVRYTEGQERKGGGTSWAEMRMVRWMRDVNVKDRVPRVERETRNNDIILVLQL